MENKSVSIVDKTIINIKIVVCNVVQLVTHHIFNRWLVKNAHLLVKAVLDSILTTVFVVKIHHNSPKMDNVLNHAAQVTLKMDIVLEIMNVLIKGVGSVVLLGSVMSVFLIIAMNQYAHGNSYYHHSSCLSLSFLSLYMHWHQLHSTSSLKEYKRWHTK